MTANPIPPATPAVIPVMPITDYEPPACAVTQGRLAVRAPSLLRPRRGHAPPLTTVPPGRPPRAVLSPAAREAAAFAETALRRVLEVVDQRRPAAHLYPLLAAGLVESVLSVLSEHPATASATGCTGAAALQRVRLQMVGSAGPPAAAEVFGTYRRGRRIHAVACRVERLPTVTGPGWQVVALHIG